MTQLENNQKKFNYLIKVSLIIYSIILLLAIMLKSFMTEDLIANFNFLSTLTLKERIIRGIRLIEFYKIEPITPPITFVIMSFNINEPIIVTS